MSGYEWLIGTRHLRSTHRRGFVSFVALMSVCGLMLGVATLIVVLSVMNGFERELRNRMLAAASHAVISGINGPLTDWRTLQSRVRREEGVQAVVPYVESQAMFANGRRMAGANVRGVLPEEERTATGLAQRSELTWQLRGTADARQVDGAELALQHNLGLGGACVVAMYKKAELV